jgi:hypothetical protein
MTGRDRRSKLSRIENIAVFADSKRQRQDGHSRHHRNDPHGAKGITNSHVEFDG